MIPVFKHTAEAIDYGQKMSAVMIIELETAKEYYSKLGNQLKSLGRWDESMEQFTKGQLCREAIETFNGTLNRRSDGISDRLVQRIESDRYSSCVHEA